MIKVGINGFGRIGRFVFRAAQRSRIISPGCGFKSEAAIIALGS